MNEAVLPIKTLYYFAYGAMVNPVSRARRGVETIYEAAARLPGYQLNFFYGGAGNVARGTSDDDEVHGVLMEFGSAHYWDIIKEFEAGYQVSEGAVFPYGSKIPVQANFFMFKQQESNQGLPSERYLKIIALGLKQHGVKESYIQRTIKSQECIPTPPPEEFLTFSSVSDDLPTITMDDYAGRCKNGEALCIIGRRKVLQLGKGYAPDDPFSTWLEANAIGKGCFSWTILQLLYEPDLPTCESEEQITDLHLAWAEHECVSTFLKTNIVVQQIGLLASDQ